MVLDPSRNLKPDSVHTIHLMGICGTGMAALAGMLKNAGYSITGSDSHVYPPMSDYLKSIGILPNEGYSPGNLAHNPDLVIVGNVITAKNPEALSLAQKNIHYLSLPQALSQFFISNKQSLVVAGTHGKTTTCSLLASALYHAGYDPSFMIGGIVNEFSSNNRYGNGSHFIVEGDEYDTAFFDKGSKFLHYQPQIAIITSIEFDHADIFDSLDQIKDSFRKFVATLPADGCIIAHLDDPNVREVVADAPCLVEGYGFSSSNIWRIEKYSQVSTTSSLEYSRGKEKNTITLPLSGKHNCLNGLSVAAVMHHLNLTSKEIQDSISQFQGVKRRQEVRGVVNDITVIDDFAHHPSAVKETLSGLRRAFPDKRLITVFEPRTNSSRRSIFQSLYSRSFNDSDITLIREPVPLHSIAPEDHFSAVQLADDLIKDGRTASSFANTDEILQYLAELLKPGDVVAILSNGGFDNIHERLLQQLET